jgi:hypothetical protein
MQLANETPFSPFVFESLDQDDRLIHCVFCRGTFDLGQDSRLLIAAQQEPVVLADRYRQDPLTSSVEVDTDLVPQKLVADITLNAIAHAPEGAELESWLVTVNIGKISKTLRVYGPRQWQHSVLREWHLSRPTPTSEVPLHYELAFGGKGLKDDGEQVFEENPVGRGFVPQKPSRLNEVIPAPQIEVPHDPVREFGRTYRPAGLGPIAKHWLPRRALCGTADESWKETRWPLRPVDFDFRYYSSSSAGLAYPGYLLGSEDVLIAGCSSRGPLQFALPGVSLTLLAVEKNFRVSVEPMTLDTLHIDLISARVYLTWRSTFPKSSPLESVLIFPRRG